MHLNILGAGSLGPIGTAPLRNPIKLAAIVQKTVASHQKSVC